MCRGAQPEYVVDTLVVWGAPGMNSISFLPPSLQPGVKVLSCCPFVLVVVVEQTVSKSPWIPITRRCSGVVPVSVIWRVMEVVVSETENATRLAEMDPFAWCNSFWSSSLRRACSLPSVPE